MKRVVLVVILVILFLLLVLGLLTCSGKSDATAGHGTTSATPVATGSTSAGDTATVGNDSGTSGFGRPAPGSTPAKPHAFAIPFIDTLIHPTSLLHTGDGVEYWRDSRLIFHQP